MNSVYQHTGTEKFSREFERLALPKHVAVSNLRKSAFAHVSELGFPTTRHEEWKYTNILPVLKSDFKLITDDQFNLTKADLQPFLISVKDAITLVFENGRFNPILSDVKIAEQGVTVGPLSNHLSNPNVKEHLAKHALVQNESFIALNTAFINEGAFIHISKSSIASLPIHLVYIQDTRSNPTVVYPRSLVIADENSQATIIESFHSIGNTNHGFCNGVNEIVVKDNAKVEFIRIQAENNLSYHINHTEASVGKDSLFDISTICLEGSIVRNNLHISMDGKNGTAHLYGFSIGDESSVIDNHTLVDHRVPNCYSNELYKGVLGGKALGVFNGKIFVRKDAQKTNAYQSNKNILLSDDATMNSKPQLEIFADDVKCSHGATTGQLDEEALFYLRSRGIGEQLAKNFLNIAFAAEVIDHISIAPLRERLMNMIEEKLQKGAS